MSWACDWGVLFNDGAAPLLFSGCLAILRETLFATFWGALGFRSHPFGIILKVLGAKAAPILVNFDGLVASLGALGAQFAPGPPGFFQRRPFFTDLGAQSNPTGDRKWSPNANKNSLKIDAKINVIFNWPFGWLWSTLGVFLGPWILENQCLV